MLGYDQGLVFMRCLFLPFIYGVIGTYCSYRSDITKNIQTLTVGRSAEIHSTSCAKKHIKLYLKIKIGSAASLNVYIKNISFVIFTLEVKIAYTTLWHLCCVFTFLHDIENPTDAYSTIAQQKSKLIICPIDSWHLYAKILVILNTLLAPLKADE